MQCTSKRADGKRCGARALSGKKLCALHDDPAKARELGAKGGRRRARSVAVGEQLAPVEPPRTAQQLRDLLADIVVELRQKKLDTKLANSLAYAGAALLRAIEVSTFETRIAKLEARHASTDPAKSSV